MRHNNLGEKTHACTHKHTHIKKTTKNQNKTTIPGGKSKVLHPLIRNRIAFEVSLEMASAWNNYKNKKDVIIDI